MDEQPQTRRQLAINIAISVVIGTLIWFYVDSRRTVTKDVPVAVDISTPQGWEWTTRPPETIRVRIQGPRTLMDTLDVRQIRWSREIARPDGVNELQIQEPVHASDILLPPGAVVVEVGTAQVTGRLVRLAPCWVRVRPKIEGKPAEGYAVAQTTVTPPFVQVMAPSNFDVGGAELETFPVIRLTGTETTSMYLKVNVASKNVGTRTLTSNDRLDASVIIQPVPKKEEFKNVKVRVLYGPLMGVRITSITPPMVTVVAEGPAKAIEALGTAGPVVYVDIAELTGRMQGEHTLPCRVMTVPELRIHSIDPQDVTLRID